tara:strand:- start:6650 stop:7501 length:852 start_codon:yes stop_codon:yes gene_type:complete
MLETIIPSVISGLFGGAGSNAAAQGSKEASKLQQEAANKAYEGGQYKPYGVTSGLGTSSFEDGQSSFTLDPRYQGQQDQMLGLGQQAFGAAGGDYNQLADQFYNQQRALGAGSRNAEALQLGESMFGTGSGGLRMGAKSLGAEGGGMMSPQGYGFAQAFAQQDALDRQSSFDRAQEQRLRDLGIGSDLLGLSTGLDQAGLDQSALGGLFGQYSSNAANQAGSNLVSGMSGGAGQLQDAGMARAGGWIGAGNSVGGMFDTPPPPTPPVTYNTNYNTSGNNPFGY